MEHETRDLDPACPAPAADTETILVEMDSALVVVIPRGIKEQMHAFLDEHIDSLLASEKYTKMSAVHGQAMCDMLREDFEAWVKAKSD